MSSDEYEVYKMLNSLDSSNSYDSYDSYDSSNSYNLYDSYDSYNSYNSYDPYDSYETYETIGTTSSDSFSYSTPISVKFQAMFGIFVWVLLIVLLGSRCLEKGNKVSKILALIGLGFGVVGMILQLALVWELFSAMETTRFFSYGLTVIGKITLFVTISMVATIGGALIMRIRENDKLVPMLKWVAAGCGFGLWMIATIIIFVNDFEGINKVLGFASVLVACFMVCWITALIISRFNRKEKEGGEFEVGVGREMEVKKVEVEPILVESFQAETIQAEPVKTESVQSETAQTEPDPLQSLQNGNNETSTTFHDVSAENNQ